MDGSLRRIITLLLQIPHHFSDSWSSLREDDLWIAFHNVPSLVASFRQQSKFWPICYGIGHTEMIVFERV